MFPFNTLPVDVVPSALEAVLLPVCEGVVLGLMLGSVVMLVITTIERLLARRTDAQKADAQKVTAQKVAAQRIDARTTEPQPAAPQPTLTPPPVRSQPRRPLRHRPAILPRVA